MNSAGHDDTAGVCEDRRDRFKGVLPSDARLASDETSVFERFQTLFDLRDASVIEIGGRIDPRRVDEAEARLWCSVDPRNEDLPPQGRVLTIPRPASMLDGVENEGFDLVFSCNAFQHIHDLAQTLEHVFRFVAPGGYLYANFGPIWSGPDGSHIENLTCGRKLFQFWERSLLPSWSHLVFDEEELVEVLSRFHQRPLAACIADYVFNSTWINRLFAEDYVRLVHDSPWRTLFIEGCSTFDYDYDPPRIDHVLMSRLRADRVRAEIQERHGPDKDAISLRDLEIILKKASSAPGHETRR